MSRREALETHFDELFEPTEGGFRQRYRPDQRQVLISWGPHQGSPRSTAGGQALHLTKRLANL